MWRNAIMAAVFLASVSVARAQAPEPGIQDVIEDQISAFRVDDFDRAFSFAAPMIRELFGTPERFGQMVRQGYPMVWRPGDLQFLGQKALPDGVEQTVMIRDGAGRIHLLAYAMIPTGTGWKINGVRVLTADAPGV